VEKTLEGVVHDDLQGAYVQSIIRLSNAFRGKALKYANSYSLLPVMVGRAYVIAIENYGTQDFYMTGDVAMQRLLYDGEGEGEVLRPNGSSVLLGLFNSPEFHMSAQSFTRAWRLLGKPGRSALATCP